MPQLEGFRVKNFKALKDVTLGKLWNQQQAAPMTPLTVVIGKNGSGKSSLFDAFGFLSDALKFDVETACEAKGRGGFLRLLSKDVSPKEAIEFEIYYRESKDSRPITYELSIALDEQERPYVLCERLRQRRKNQKTGKPYSFLRLNKGRGKVWKNNALDAEEEDAESELVKLENARSLGIATLGALKQHPRIASFCKFIEGWFFSYFTPDAARSLPLAGPQRHLDAHGENLANVVQFMWREQPKAFKKVLKQIAKKIPDIESIKPKKTLDGRLLLEFRSRSFKEPFYSQQMSDGTLKLFTYLLLLEDTAPYPFLCIEEPENGLYHKLLEILASEFREHSQNSRGLCQVFVTTHQPYFVNALKPEEVWILEKKEDGFSTIRRVCNNSLVRNLVKEGLPLGGLWYSDYLDEE